MTTTSNRSASIPSGSGRGRLVGEVVDGGDVEAHGEAVVVAQGAHEVDELLAARVQHALAAARRDGDAVHELRLAGASAGASSTVAVSSVIVRTDRW